MSVNSIKDASVQHLRYIGGQAGSVLIRHGVRTIGDMLEIYNKEGPEKFFEKIVNILKHYNHFPNRYLLDEMEDIKIEIEKNELHPRKNEGKNICVSAQ